MPTTTFPKDPGADRGTDGRASGRRVSRRLRASPSCAPRAPAERQRRDWRGSKVGVFSALQLYIQRRMLRNRFDIHLKVSLTAFFEPLIFSLLFCHRIGVFFFLHVQMSFQDQTFPFRLREHGNSSNQIHKSPGLYNLIMLLQRKNTNTKTTEKRDTTEFTF